VRRVALLLPLLAALLALPGCGDRNLILTVDLLSFLAPADRTVPYGPIPPGVTGADVDVASQEVNLLEGLGDAVDVESASLRIGVRFENQTGSATGSLRIYIAPGDSADPFGVPPLANLPVTLAPNDTTRVETEIDSSPELAAALTQSRAKIGVRISFDTTGSVAPLQGVETSEELVAIVVTKRSM